MTIYKKGICIAVSMLGNRLVCQGINTGIMTFVNTDHQEYIYIYIFIKLV
jgi:hypothetical protein